MKYRKDPMIVMDEIESLLPKAAVKHDLSNLRKRLYHLSEFPIDDKALARQGKLLDKVNAMMKELPR